MCGLEEEVNFEITRYPATDFTSIFQTILRIDSHLIERINQLEYRVHEDDLKSDNHRIHHHRKTNNENEIHRIIKGKKTAITITPRPIQQKNAAI